MSFVAPFAGAWIEIVTSRSHHGHMSSLPSPERGLKLYIWSWVSMARGRSLRGSVD